LQILIQVKKTATGYPTTSALYFETTSASYIDDVSDWMETKLANVGCKTLKELKERVIELWKR
jgi:hypothetical protein